MLQGLRPLDVVLRTDDLRVHSRVLQGALRQAVEVSRYDHVDAPLRDELGYGLVRPGRQLPALLPVLVGGLEVALQQVPPFLPGAREPLEEDGVVGALPEGRLVPPFRVVDAGLLPFGGGELADQVEGHLPAGRDLRGPRHPRAQEHGVGAGGLVQRQGERHLRLDARYHPRPRLSPARRKRSRYGRGPWRRPLAPTGAHHPTSPKGRPRARRTSGASL